MSVCRLECNIIIIIDIENRLINQTMSASVEIKVDENLQLHLLSSFPDECLNHF